MIAAIVLAAGKSTRMGSKINKPYILLGNKPVIYYSLNAFEKNKLIDSVVVVVKKGEQKRCGKIARQFKFKKVKAIIIGGAKRQDSVYNALKHINSSKPDMVVVHDAARPFIEDSMITEIIKEAKKKGAAITAIPLADTIRTKEKTLDRKGIWIVQTPQAFLGTLLFKAYNKAYKDSFLGTDDASVMEKMGHSISIVKGSSLNIKITTKEDLKLANALGTVPEGGLSPFLVGIGYDIHPLVINRKLILGGIGIPYEKGLSGHSDGDCLTHAIMDAVLGACGLGDIGKLFGRAKPKYKNISSIILFKKVMEIIAKKKFSINNIDVVVLCESPSLKNYKKAMQLKLAKVMKIPKSNVNIKATSAKGIGEIGANEAISAIAIVSLWQKKELE